MAGDWIKMRSDLFTHPKVVRMASALKADGRPDVLRVVGALMSVWCLFDAHSVDGVLDGYTPELVDDQMRWDGFCEAMKSVGWLEFGSANSSMRLPEFEKHNGQSAKRRAQDADRKREVRKTSADEADKKRTREEKRRSNNPPTPKGEQAEPAGFARFWAAWPKSDRKGGKGKCLQVWWRAKLEPIAQQIVSHVERMAETTDWRKDAGAYVPAPLVYLNQRRWDGAEESRETQDRWTGAL